MERNFTVTNTILLKTTTPDEAAALFPIFSNPENVKYTNFKTFTDIPALHTFLEMFLSLNLNAPLQYGPYSVYLDDAIIGLCGVQQIDLAAGRSEVWYILHKDHWGKGIAKQILRLLVNECKTNMQLKQVYAEAVTANTASWTILEHAGFINTGEVKDGFKKGDIVEDLRSYTYSCNA